MRHSNGCGGPENHEGGDTPPLYLIESKRKEFFQHEIRPQQGEDKTSFIITKVAFVEQDVSYIYTRSGEKIGIRGN